MENNFGKFKSEYLEPLRLPGRVNNIEQPEFQEAEEALRMVHFLQQCTKMESIPQQYRVVCADTGVGLFTRIVAMSGGNSRPLLGIRDLGRTVYSTVAVAVSKASQYFRQHRNGTFIVLCLSSFPNSDLCHTVALAIERQAMPDNRSRTNFFVFNPNHDENCTMPLRIVRTFQKSARYCTVITDDEPNVNGTYWFQSWRKCKPTPKMSNLKVCFLMNEISIGQTNIPFEVPQNDNECEQFYHNLRTNIRNHGLMENLFDVDQTFTFDYLHENEILSLLSLKDLKFFFF